MECSKRNLKEEKIVFFIGSVSGRVHSLWRVKDTSNAVGTRKKKLTASILT